MLYDEPNLQNIPVPLNEKERERAASLKHALIRGLGVPDMSELHRYFSDLSQIVEHYVDMGTMRTTIGDDYEEEGP